MKVTATIIEKDHLWPTMYVITDENGVKKEVSKSKLYDFARKNNIQVDID